MIQHYIVTDTFTHQIDCYCPGEEHVDVLTLKEGDVIEVTPDGKFTFGNGWYFLIVINYQSPIYLSLDDLEHYYRRGQILSSYDLELKSNYIQNKINQALDTKNKDSFLNYTSELNHLSNLKEKYNTFLTRIESLFYI